MRREVGRWWLERGTAPSWQSRVVAFLATTALFVAAFLAMTTLRGQRRETLPAANDRTTVVEFQPPRPVAPPPRPIVPPRRTSPRQAVVPSPPGPVTRAPVTQSPPLITPPSTNAPRDSSRLGGKIPTGPLSPLGPIFEPPTIESHPDPATTARGAPISRAGVTGESPALTPSQRDSILALKMALIAKMSRDWVPSEEDKREIAQREKELGGGARRGAGGLGVGGSIPFPLFSKGPSPAERKRNEKIDADNQLRLKRLQERAVALRDSLRADSLRRDSIARKNAVRP